MSKAVVLFSGGLDSTTCLAVATQQHNHCYALSFHYGQKHSAELDAATQIAQHFGVAKHIIMPLQHLDQLAPSALTSSSIDVQEGSINSNMPNTYVPARNTLFLSMAMAWAESIGASAIYLGVSAVDYSGYPDCRPCFIEAFQQLMRQASLAQSPLQQCQLNTPLLHLSKAETIQLGLKHGVDYGMTVSCYRADEHGRACGSCDSCLLRKQGFAAAGVSDPTRYY